MKANDLHNFDFRQVGSGAYKVTYTFENGITQYTATIGK